MIHRLRKENPEQRFFPASPYLVCPTMKLTTLRHLAEALAELRTVVTVDDAVRAGARAALDAMLAVSAIHPVRLAR
jgi:quinolinate synthase